VQGPGLNHYFINNERRPSSAGPASLFGRPSVISGRPLREEPAEFNMGERARKQARPLGQESLAQSSFDSTSRFRSGGKLALGRPVQGEFGANGGADDDTDDHDK